MDPTNMIPEQKPEFTQGAAADGESLGNSLPIDQGALQATLNGYSPEPSNPPLPAVSAHGMPQAPHRGTL